MSKAGQTAPIQGCSVTETVQNRGMVSLSGNDFGLTGAPDCFRGGRLPYALTVALPSSFLTLNEKHSLFYLILTKHAHM